jgi:ERF superfamily
MIINTEQDFEAQQAFGEALREIVNVAKTQTADTGKYTYHYADLGDVLDECKRACALHDLVLTQVPTVQDGHLAVGMWLLHKSGGQVVFDPLMMMLPKEAQAYGSALTYARRYQLLTVFGIAPEDDDGRAATVSAQTQPGRRTEAERMIRESIATMDDPTRAAFVTAFKEQFGVSLTDLPAAKHGDALTWSKEWYRDYTPPQTLEELRDEVEAQQ